MRHKKRKKLTRHHLKNKENGGGNEPYNILKLTLERHSIFHKLFGSKEIPEIIKLLQRVQKLKDGLRDRGY